MSEHLNRAVDDLIRDHERTRGILEWAIEQFAYLETRSLWSQEDNFYVAEALAALVADATLLTREEKAAIVVEAGLNVECPDCLNLFTCDPGEIALYEGRCPNCARSEP